MAAPALLTAFAAGFFAEYLLSRQRQATAAKAAMQEASQALEAADHVEIRVMGGVL